MRARSSLSGADLIARAHGFVATHPTAKFAGTISVKGGTDRSPTAPAQTPLARVAGELHAPGRAHALIADDASAAELVLVGRAVYVRAGEAPAELANAVYRRADAEVSRVMRVRAEQAKTFDLPAVLAAVTNAKTIRRSGATSTVEADVAPAALYGRRLSRHVAWVTIRAVVADDGEITRLQVLTRAEASILTRVAFSEWGDKAIAIAAPSSTQVDHTPPVAQAKLASFTGAPLLMPKALPDGWDLVRTDVLAADDTQEGCAQAELAYEDQARGDTGYLYLYELPKTCAAKPPSDTTPFRAGDYTGFAATQDGPYVQIVAGRTTVQAVSDLPLDELARVLSELVPLALQSA